MDWWIVIANFIACAACYVIGYAKGRNYDDKPYKWACPRETCEFSVSGNHVELVIEVSDRHERSCRV